MPDGHPGTWCRGQPAGAMLRGTEDDVGRDARLKRQRREARKRGLKLPVGKDKRYLGSVLAGRRPPPKKPWWLPQSFTVEPSEG